MKAQLNPLILFFLATVAIVAPSAQAADSIQFTSVPPYGSQSNLFGQVHGVNPANFRVAVLIYLDGLGWFSKPTCATPLSTIAADGTWTADITTGGIDSNAVRIAAFVVPSTFSQPCLTGSFCIPDVFYQQSVANTSVTRTPTGVRSFHWSGFDWSVKTSGVSTVGPGPNFFSDSTNNVFIDSSGRLHLRIINVGGNWQCAEVVSQSTPGYGTYRFHLAFDPNTLDQNVTLGLFTWSNETPFFDREMDNECGRWENPNDYANSQFVVQPYYAPSQLVRYRVPFLVTNAVPAFNWTTNSIIYTCTTGTNAVLPAAAITNQLVNPGFESGSGTAASNWTEFNDAYRAATNNTLSQTTALGGANSMKIYGPFNASPGIAGAFQDIHASPGQTWEFYGFGLNWSGDPMTNTTGYGVAQLIFLNSSSNAISTSESQHFDSTTPYDQWQYFLTVGTAPAGTVAVRLQVLHSGSAGIAGSVWWDELVATTNIDNSIARYTFTNAAAIPPSCDENVRINLWLVNGNPPSNGQTAEAILDSFEFVGTDTDGDGMPDAWEIAHGLNPTNPADANLDSDGDGFSNLQEYLAGTDPANPASSLHVTSSVITGHDVQVSFASVLDKNYLLERSISLTPTNWLIITQNVAGTGGAISLTDSGAATNFPARYYRVRLMQ